MIIVDVGSPAPLTPLIEFGASESGNADLAGSLSLGNLDGSSSPADQETPADPTDDLIDFSSDDDAWEDIESRDGSSH
jgi:hypothetical protein